MQIEIDNLQFELSDYQCVKYLTELIKMLSISVFGKGKVGKVNTTSKEQSHSSLKLIYWQL